ncbi:MAG: DUF3343 domain-containing protein [Clostridia bacterium]|nr:DUF3343 domain-containing protein [Clostridia bacterium]
MGKGYYIKVNSVTHAIKAKDVLNANGFKAQVVRKSKQGRSESCGYSVVIDGDITRAEAILRNYHVRTSGYGEIRDKL